MVSLATNEKLFDFQEQYINQLYKNGEYEKCYDSCVYLLSLLPVDKKMQMKLKKFCYLREAVCLRKQFKFKEAIEKADIAIKYCTNKDDYYSIIHLKAIAYKRLGFSDKAIKCLNSCIKWYKHNSMHYELAMMYEIKGEILKSEKYFTQSLTEYYAALEEGNYFDKDMLQREIDNVYQELIKLYINIGEQNMIKAYQMLNSIQTKDMKQQSKGIIKEMFRREVK